MTMLRVHLVATAAALAAASCGGGSAVGVVRFANRPPVWRVNDRVDTPVKPVERVFVRSLYMFDGYYHRRLARWMEMHERVRARDVNALDEVPDSTWFTNRIGVRDLSVEEVRRGPNRTGSPMDHKPWTIRSSKVGGTSVGFIIKDTRGKKYLLKFDQSGTPETETASHVIVQRILWACGYNVPEDDVVWFRRGDLVIAPDAVIKDPFGGEKRLTRTFLDEQLAKVDIGPFGSIRGLASLFVEGVPVGGQPGIGVRPDDPNDLVAHELRRDVRGQYPIFAWLDHTDIKESQTVDSWVEDPGDRRRHYVVHYLLDFGKALGTQAYMDRVRYLGHANTYDFGDMALSLVTLGMWKRPWEDRRAPELVGVGLYEAATYDPGRWKPSTPSYYPFAAVDRFDAFWGAKILIRFTPAHLAVVIGQAGLTDPRSREYLLDTLVARQRKTARYWFERVNPLDRFAVAGVEGRPGEHQLCFDDLALVHRLTDPAAGPTTYAATAFDWDGDETGWRGNAAPATAGRACLSGLRPAGGPDGYTIVKIETRRKGRALPATLIHLALDPARRTLRIIGLRRL